MDSDVAVALELSDEQRWVLRCGLREWGGSARCTDTLAAAMGFGSVADLFGEADRIVTELVGDQPIDGQDWQRTTTVTLVARDWWRTMMATEFVFASATVGVGLDWPITAGISDARTIEVLRELQRKMFRHGEIVRFRRAALNSAGID
ncbi:hypothetical protein OG563_07170 [Nocardia vinacea]|uniref:DUF222 domain-containing protein n=1 Tax=Nocardia vinacea TaxID=96468 RepID=A0ABZ1YY81_9NOCA|nr:hypothetical protein [Nocardia vinacea]